MAQEVLIAETEDRAKLRNPWGVLGLSLITIGIYLIWWWYYINREMRDYGRATGHDLGQKPTNSALAIFPGGLILIPAWISLWRGTLRAQGAQKLAGIPLLSGWIALILYLLIGFLYPPYIQHELNKVWRRVGRALPGETMPSEADGMPPELPADDSQVPPSAGS